MFIVEGAAVMLLCIIIACTYFYFLACVTYVGFVAVSFSGELLFETVTFLCYKNCQK